MYAHKLYAYASLFKKEYFTVSLFGSNFHDIIDTPPHVLSVLMVNMPIMELLWVMTYKKTPC